MRARLLDLSVQPVQFEDRPVEVLDLVRCRQGRKLFVRQKMKSSIHEATLVPATAGFLM